MSNSGYEIKTDSDGSKYWYLNGKCHREDGPAYEGFGGTKYWYLNDKLHREDGPAYEGSDGTKSWYLNDKLHREDGPAIEYSDGSKEWFLSGKYYSKKEWRIKIELENLKMEEVGYLFESPKPSPSTSPALATAAPKLAI